MKRFEDNWRALAAHAREAAPRDVEAPLGFATRVVARAWAREAPAADLVWNRIVPRFLAGALAILFICTALEWRHLGGGHPLAPGIENSVAKIVWTL